MFLSKIELQGFKSFADKTVFAFDSGITAVLGPNGCGKSNVVDAVKWVLGETKAKSLRGSSMQDVIFAGSAHRKPLGMAEVSLVFDNTEGKLPIEYNEVSVTRRLYRSGESEYLINKRPCRRRDITELLMDTGVGTTAYSIIEQGKVEALLHAKPQERRAVFEEAAGITKYKERRKRALARLDRTEQCLLRVNDIVDELDRGVRRLNRQASAARRHQTLSTEQHELKTLLYARTSRALSTRLATLAKEQAEMDDLFTQESGELARLTSLLAEMTQRETSFGEQAETLESELLNLQESIGTTQAEATAAAERLSALKRERSDAAERIERLGQTLSEQRAGLDAALEEAERTEAELSTVESDLQASDDERNAFELALREADRHLEAIRVEADAAANDRHALTADAARLESETESLEGRLTALRQREATIDQDLSAGRERLAEFEQKSSALIHEATGLDARLKAAREQRDSHQGEAAQAAEQLSDLNQKRSGKASRLETLEDLAASLQGTHAGVKNVLSAKREGHPACTEVRGIIAEAMRVQPEHALAIETAAGGQAQDVIVDSAAGAQSCIEFLKESRGGRATFLPLDRIRPRRRADSNLLHLPGVIGEAVDLVEFDPAFRPAMEYVLAGILIVRDISCARQLAAGQARGVRLVTLEGEVINQHGAMTGGTDRKQAGGLITRRAEMDALKEEVADLDRRVSDTTRSRDAAIAATAAATREAEQVEEELVALNHRQRDVEKQLSLASGETERLSRERDGLAADLAELTTAREGLDQRRQVLTTRIAETEAVVTERRAALEEAASAKNTAAERLDQAREANSARREARAGLATRVAELRRRADDAQKAIVSREKEIVDLQSFVERTASDTTGLAETQQQQEETVRAKMIERDNLMERLQALRQQFHEIRDQAEARREEERSRQRRIDEIREARNSLSLQATETNMKRESLDEKAAEELTIESLSEKAEAIIAQAEAAVAPPPSEEEDASDDEDSAPPSSDDLLPVQMSDEQLRERIQEVTGKLSRIGPVNLCAIDELAEMEARRDFLIAEQEDLNLATQDLQQVIDRLNEECQKRFTETFDAVRENFKDLFTRLFNGGTADIVLEHPEGEVVDPLDMGIDIIARPPGKQAKKISLLSGGEKALCTVALLFAIFRSKPSPFCILDEVDGPLDESNIDIFMRTVKEFSKETQFLVITHAKRTMSMTDTIYGVTQKEPGVSSHYSLSFTQMHEQVTDEENRSALDGSPLPASERVTAPTEEAPALEAEAVES